MHPKIDCKFNNDRLSARPLLCLRVIFILWIVVESWNFGCITENCRHIPIFRTKITHSFHEYLHIF
jgi:hypothetical protein